MIAPAWLRTATQPIGIDDVIAYLRDAPWLAETSGREVQIGVPTSSPTVTCWVRWRRPSASGSGR